MNGPDALADERRVGRTALPDAGTERPGTERPGTEPPGTERPAGAPRPKTPRPKTPRPGTSDRGGRHTSTKSRTKLAPVRLRRLSLSNWPVAARLIAVAAVASMTGLVFGGLAVCDAINTADAYGRTAQLAILGEQVTTLAQAMENERDLASGVSAYDVLTSDSTAARAGLSVTSPIRTALRDETADLQTAEQATDTQAQRTRGLAVAIGSAFPASVQAKAATVVQTIDSIPGLRNQMAGLPANQVISDYSTSIGTLFDLNDEITSGSGDPTLADEVRALDALSRAKDEASQQRAILYSALLESTVYDAGGGKTAPYNNLPPTQPLTDAGGIRALATAQGLQNADITDFQNAATTAESNAFAATVAGPAFNQVQLISGNVATFQDPRLLFEPVNGAPSIGFDRATIASAWYSDMSAVIGELRTIEAQLAAQSVARAQALRQQAVGSAIATAAVTAGAVLLVLLATALVGRTLVNPLRKLQADALEIATSRLPARVAAAASGADSPEASAMVEPIGVKSTDEIGRVARAFDQVHAEAVRLAGTEAQLRGSLNAMFISLSRRSVPLIERLSRMIDSMEQNEDDPDLLANLFAMDHMVTRMRRNSENLLVLGGEEPVRKWTESVPLSDVARAAAAEIEQYNRVALAVQPGIVISGHAAADVVHMLAELIENATLFSPQSTQVRVTVTELSSGGVLIEVRDDGVGISPSRLTDLNWRLDHPPVVDVSISRHMGLYAVSRLAARHGIKVRLRPGMPQGLSALAWLPGYLAKQGPTPASGSHTWLTAAGTRAEARSASAKRAAGRHRNGTLGTTGEQLALARHGAPAGRPGTVWFTAKRPSGGPVKSAEEIAAGWRSPGNGRTTSSTPAGTSLAGTSLASTAPAPRAASNSGGFAAVGEVAGRTTSGLPRRTPRTSPFPGSDTPGNGIPAAAAAAMTAPATTTGGVPVFGAPPDVLAAREDTPDRQHHEQAPLRRRSPEAARSRLSGFQLGGRDALEADREPGWGQHAGEENGR
jgi:signal transduction histidine kinase